MDQCQFAVKSTLPLNLNNPEDLGRYYKIKRSKYRPVGVKLHKGPYPLLRQPKTGRKKTVRFKSGTLELKPLENEELFGNDSVGENLDYSELRNPFSGPEKRFRGVLTLNEKMLLERQHEEYYNNLRQPAEVHRELRNYIQNKVHPGLYFLDIVEEIEKAMQRVVMGNSVRFAYPPMLALNNQFTNYTVDINDQRVLMPADVLKIDLGISVDGYMARSAFSMTFADDYYELLQVAKEVTDKGIQAAGIDCLLLEVGEEMQELLNSYEFGFGKRPYWIRSVPELYGGHSLERNFFNSGNPIPLNAEMCDSKKRMCENETYVIGCYTSTGEGQPLTLDESTILTRECCCLHKSLTSQTSKEVYGIIDRHFGCMPFCKRWLAEVTTSRQLPALDELYEKGLVVGTEPYCDIVGSFTAHYSHTVLLKAARKEVLTRGDDY